MNKIFLILILAITFGCNSGNSEEVIAPTTPASDTLMDSTTIQMKADTTVKRLDNLEDSINKLRNKAAQEN